MARRRTVPAELDGYGQLLLPTEAAEPILSKGVRSALTSWLEEVFAEKELKAVGLEPRRKALFDGPPGVGKTTLAHHLAARLGLPMLAARVDQMIDVWCGGTARNIGGMFTALERGVEIAGKATPVLLFMDEFDALARQRRGAQQGADDERNAYVNALLQRLEQHTGFVIAATNFRDSIDQAVWRRFDVHMTLELPGQVERERILARYLAPYGLPPAELTALAQGLETASPALMRKLCEGLKRTLVLGPRLKWDMGRAGVIERVLATVQPHQDAGLPRLWSHGAKDAGWRAISWPLPLAKDLPKLAPPAATPSAGNVIAADFGGGR